MKNLSLRTKLLVALLGVGVLGVLVTGWQAARRAETALKQASVNQLTSIRDERRRAIEAYFADVRNQAAILAESHVITTAMPQFRAAYRDFAREVVRLPAATRARYAAQLDSYYRTQFLPRLKGLETELHEKAAWQYRPADDAAIVLQDLYIDENPNPEGSRDLLDRAAGGGRYTQIHAQFNPVIRSVIRQLGYYDLFLIDHEDGRVVYTLAKEIDFGTNLLSGPYRDTNLGRAFRAARGTIEADFIQLVDFESYVPSLGAPSAFVAAPIFMGGRRLGVLALQLPHGQIDAVMTGGRRWEEQGLGRTGETYLVGADFRMRSNSRFFLEQPAQYVAKLSQTGFPERVRELIETHRSTVLFQEIRTSAAEAALSGHAGARTQIDYLGEAVLSLYAPVSIPGLHWAIVSNLDTDEAFAPVMALRRALLATAAGIGGLVVAVALVFARSLTAPIQRLIAGMDTFGRGDLSHRLNEVRGDEIGKISTAFNRMADDLLETTVSRDHVNSILASMSDAVIVVRPPGEGSDWRDAVIVTVNPAACAMLGRAQAEILGQPIGSFIPAITRAAGAGSGEGVVWLEEVLRHGRIGGREVVYKIRDGREIPVLFSSAVMREGTSAVQSVVCAAHDLTELKAVEARGAFIRETFGRYVSDEVVASLLSSPEALKLGGERRRVTVMMSDLRGFTHLAERLSPEEAISLLNGYLHTMVDVILRYRGTINAIMGDGILVVFGAPTGAEEDAERAVACAVAMQLAMDEVNAESRRRGLPAVEMGIGIHTGEVIVGNIGSDRRMTYTAVGTHVNLAGRIESYTTGGQILISEDTMQEVASVVTAGRQMRIEPKGAAHELTVWEVTGIGGTHGLFLGGSEPPMITLAAEIPVRYAVLEEKHVGRSLFDGSFVRLSPKRAEVRSANPVPALTNVKVWVLDPGAGSGPAELYAKVVETGVAPEAFTIRFTAMPPEVACYLERCAAGSAT